MDMIEPKIQNDPNLDLYIYIFMQTHLYLCINIYIYVCIIIYVIELNFLYRNRRRCMTKLQQHLIKYKTFKTT